MTSEPEYRRNAVLWRRTYDRVVILVPGKDGFLTLSATGCDLWAALETPGTLRALAQRLAAIYEAPVEQIAADIIPVIENLERGGAIVNSGTAP